MSDGHRHLIVDDLAAEVRRLRADGVHFRNDIVTGPVGSQILPDDPSGNPIELFQPRRVTSGRRGPVPERVSRSATASPG
jgi:hypothetical protein